MTTCHDAELAQGPEQDDRPRAGHLYMIGDGLSLDSTGMVVDPWESGQFSFEVNDPTQAASALRHKGGANILFVNGHAANIVLRSFTKGLREQPKIKVQTRESEYVNASGKPVDASKYKPIEQQGIGRNPNMPLIWSNPPKLHR